MSFEEMLGGSLFQQNSERTFLDKLYARKDVEHVRELMVKNNLERSDMIEILYMLSSNEIKLVNYGSWDRYLMAKLFVWIREFVSAAEDIYDYEDDLAKKNFKRSKRHDMLLKNAMRKQQHLVKFLVDLYFNLARSSLSLGGTGFLESLKNKYELDYKQPSLGVGGRVDPAQSTVIQ